MAGRPPAASHRGAAGGRHPHPAAGRPGQPPGTTADVDHSGGFPAHPRANFSYRVTRDPDVVREFHARHYAPLVAHRFPEDGEIVRVEEMLDRLNRGGELVCADIDGAWVAGMFNLANPESYDLGSLGIRDADDAVRQKRVVAALIVRSLEQAVELGRGQATLGRSLPFLGKGPVWFKAKWGGTLTRGALGPVQDLHMFMDIRHAAVRRMLSASPISTPKFPHGSSPAGNPSPPPATPGGFRASPVGTSLRSRKPSPPPARSCRRANGSCPSPSRCGAPRRPPRARPGRPRSDSSAFARTYAASCRTWSAAFASKADALGADRKGVKNRVQPCSRSSSRSVSPTRSKTRTGSKRQAEVNVLRTVEHRWGARRLPGLVDPATHLLFDNTEAVCLGRGKRHASRRYGRFACVRPAARPQARAGPIL